LLKHKIISYSLVGPRFHTHTDHDAQASSACSFLTSTISASRRIICNGIERRCRIF
jgi:hypothetical protein